MTAPQPNPPLPPWPSELRFQDDGRRLAIRFEDGAAETLSAEMLRVLSPSAEVQGHTPEQRRVVGGKRNVRVVRAEPVGRYAVRLVFDDGHATGLFTWEYLYTLVREKDTKWAHYLAELRECGLAR